MCTTFLVGEGQSVSSLVPRCDQLAFPVVFVSHDLRVDKTIVGRV
jgi:hypothetical protein